MLSGADPVLALKLLAAGLVLLIVLGLMLLGVVLRAQAAHRRRLKRVSRSKIIGRFDPDEVRLKLHRTAREASHFDRLSEAAARILPVLDTDRLRANFDRAGLDISIGRFVTLTVLLALPITGLAWLVIGVPPLFAPPLGFLAAMYASNGFVVMKGDRMAARFMGQLPDALDTIIRGIRSGLPVSECINMVGKEFDAPLGGYFASIGERVKLGESLDASLWGVARVIRRPEMDFLAVCISIQMETGGSLAEALSGLGDLLRKRQQMRLKIKAISSEAKASGLIIGALPFVMLALLSVMAPEYVAPLFSDPRGHMLLGAGFVSISIGAFIMWRMTQFEI